MMIHQMVGIPDWRINKITNSFSGMSSRLCIILELIEIKVFEAQTNQCLLIFGGGEGMGLALNLDQTARVKGWETIRKLSDQCSL